MTIMICVCQPNNGSHKEEMGTEVDGSERICFGSQKDAGLESRCIGIETMSKQFRFN